MADTVIDVLLGPPREREASGASPVDASRLFQLSLDEVDGQCAVRSVQYA